jgi:rhodanese-related sulfurtransferase
MIDSITPLDLFHWLNDSSRPAPFVLDVRTKEERDLAMLPGSFWIPMDQITQSLNNLPEEQMIVTLCHHGIRSFHVASYLKQSGFEHVLNLKGGIDAWAQTVDTQMLRY